MNVQKIISALLLTLGTFCLVDCSKENNPPGRLDLDTISFEHSMKGWELYSWQNGKDWNYSVLMGTNRIKTYEEVINNKIIVCGKDSLKLLLDKFPANEYIFWIGKQWLEQSWPDNHGNLSLPDAGTIEEIKNYCLQKKLILELTAF